VKSLDAYPTATVIGLTATPVAVNGKLSASPSCYEDLVVAATPAELMAMGALVRYDAFAYDAPDLHDVGVVAGDYNQKQLGLACNTSVLVGSVVREYLEHAAGRRGILFPVDVEHSMALVGEFCRAGVAAEHLDCHAKDRARAHPRRPRLGRGHHRVERRRAHRGLRLPGRRGVHPGAADAVADRCTCR
jgi:superfamily II DNA or RNA helicase